MQNQINLTPVVQFTQTVRAAEASQAREVKLSIQQARALVLVLSEIQDKLLQDYETMFNQLKQNIDTEIISIQVDGGGFKSE